MCAYMSEWVSVSFLTAYRRMKAQFRDIQVLQLKWEKTE